MRYVKQETPTTFDPVVVIADALLPLCDDLPGERPALIAWAPDALAKQLVRALRDNGFRVSRTGAGLAEAAEGSPDLLATAVDAALDAAGHDPVMCDTLADEPCDCPYPEVATRAGTAALAATVKFLADALRAEGQRRAIHWRDEDTLDASRAADLIERLGGLPAGGGTAGG